MEAKTVQQLADALSTAESLAAENLRRAPYSTLTLAAAVGFVLGGGMTPRILYAALWLGGRTAAAAIAKELVVGTVNRGLRRDNGNGSASNRRDT